MPLFAGRIPLAILSEFSSVTPSDTEVISLRDSSLMRDPEEFSPSLNYLRVDIPMQVKTKTEIDG